MSGTTTIADKTVLVTGANRGIGKALVDEIFPDPLSETMAESWRSGAAKALERQNAAFVEAEPIPSPGRLPARRHDEG